MEQPWVIGLIEGDLRQHSRQQLAIVPDPLIVGQHYGWATAVEM